MVENRAELATQKFDKAIYGIRDARVGNISEIADRVVGRIRGGNLHVLANNANFRIPSITGFDCFELSSPVRREFAAGIIIDVDKILSSSGAKVENDLVRTLAIADQFPFNGFERRLRDVYQDALSVQEQWQAAKPDISFSDSTRGENSLRTLLGDARYYSDTGVDDWKAAIAKYPQPTAMQRKLLQDLGSSSEHFLAVRHALTGMHHSMAMQQGGAAYLNMSPDERAAFTALVLLESSLRSAPGKYN